MNDNNYNEKIEAARQELAMVQAELDTLRARKSIAECIRETFSQVQPIQIIIKGNRLMEAAVLVTTMVRMVLRKSWDLVLLAALPFLLHGIATVLAPTIVRPVN